MLDQNTFMETIKAVSEIMRTSQEPLSKEEILSYFKDMELNENQENMVLEFLLTPQEETAEEEQDKEAEEAKVEETDTECEKSDKQEEKQTDNECMPDSRMFQMYLEELSDIPEYSREQMNEMYAKLLDGDEGMIHAISNAWLRNVLEIAKKLAVSSDGFEDVVQEGTGRKLKDRSYTAAGKTGSAEFSSDKSESHAWFTGFAPAEDPEIAVTVIVESAGSGSDYAVPLARQVFDAYFSD